MKGRGFIIGLMAFPLSLLIIGIILANFDLMTTLALLPFMLVLIGIIIGAVLNNSGIAHSAIGCFFVFVICVSPYLLFVTGTGELLKDIMLFIGLTLAGIVGAATEFERAKIIFKNRKKHILR